MLISVLDTYHNKSRIIEAESIEQATNIVRKSKEMTASYLAENEIKEDWTDYHKNKTRAYDMAYDDILTQLMSEQLILPITNRSLEYTQLLIYCEKLNQ